MKLSQLKKGDKFTLVDVLPEHRNEVYVKGDYDEALHGYLVTKNGKVVGFCPVDTLVSKFDDSSCQHLPKKLPSNEQHAEDAFSLEAEFYYSIAFNLLDKCFNDMGKLIESSFAEHNSQLSLNLTAFAAEILRLQKICQSYIDDCEKK